MDENPYEAPRDQWPEPPEHVPEPREPMSAMNRAGIITFLVAFVIVAIFVIAAAFAHPTRSW